MSPVKALICGGGSAGPALAHLLAGGGHHVTVVERSPALRATGAQIDLRTKSGKGAQTATSKYEIMRGDLIRVLYDATKDSVKYIFAITVERFHWSGRQESRIRQAILPAQSPEPYRRLGIYFAYWFVPRTEVDSNISKAYHTDGGRAKCPGPTMQRASIEKQKEFSVQKFSGARWQADSFIEGMKATENFYRQEIIQVQTDIWYKNRVLLLGDAGYCLSPVTGMGITASFVGAYVLAGRTNQNPQNLPPAFANYEKTLRPFVDEIQTLNSSVLRLRFPQTQLGVCILHFYRWDDLGLPEIAAGFSGVNRGGWELPNYPELQQFDSSSKEQSH